MGQVIQLDRSFDSAINELVSRSFKYPAGTFFFDDFPVWNTNEVIRLGILEAGKLVSHVGVRLAQMKTSAGIQPVSLIGAVATDEAFRGRGFSTLLLKEAIQISEKQSCTWTFLWGSEHEFYQKLGFDLHGIQARAPLSALSVDLSNFAPGELLEKNLKKGMNEAIFTSLKENAQAGGISLSDKDHAWVFAQKTVKWFYLEKPFAFVAYEKGLDLQHIVHEFGGDLKGIQKILFQIHSADPQAQIIATTQELLQLGFHSGSILEEYLCLAKPLTKDTRWNSEFWISGIGAC